MIEHSAQHFLVAISDQVAGIVSVGPAHAEFSFVESYVESPDRAVLGLGFEENLHAAWNGTNRFPAWFSNLLPEGHLRAVIGEQLRLPRDNATDVRTEARLFEVLGDDLPGAVTLAPITTEHARELRLVEASGRPPTLLQRNASVIEQGVRFSVAGVQLKFSMRREGERLSVPYGREGEQWLLKMPDLRIPQLPVNEFAMMTWARLAGIDVPDIELIERGRIDGLRETAWAGEDKAFAIRRFDRTAEGPVHIEDLQQVRMLYPGEKYRGNFETVASLLFRGRDSKSLIEFARRLAFGLCIGNHDAHFKNWSLIYRDGRLPGISPAYDLVSVVPYPEHADRDTGLAFCGVRSYEKLGLHLFDSLARRVGASMPLRDVAAETVERMLEAQDEIYGLLQATQLIDPIRNHFGAVAKRFGVR